MCERERERETDVERARERQEGGRKEKKLPSVLLSSFKRTRTKSKQPSAVMAADGTGTTLPENQEVLSFQEHECNTLKRHARVTVKYNRKELQRRLDLEKWIDDSLDRLYKGQVGGWTPKQEKNHCSSNFKWPASSEY